tara:strand:- start:63 stop:278 length:216 start_codon:yes stop_codon:yes gene_type:complete
MIAKSFKIGQLVTCLPEYDITAMPKLVLPFEGIGIIIEIKWPDAAKIYTNKGEIICLKTEKLKSVKLKKVT